MAYFGSANLQISWASLSVITENALKSRKIIAAEKNVVYFSLGILLLFSSFSRLAGAKLFYLLIRRASCENFQRLAIVKIFH